jgi:hypothetical protein
MAMIFRIIIYNTNGLIPPKSDSGLIRTFPLEFECAFVQQSPPSYVTAAAA